jgi:hypothetical protein
MEDSISETLKQRCNRLKGEAYARDHIFGENRVRVLSLAELPHPWMLKHIDCFVSQSRRNVTIEEVHIYPYSNDGEDHAFMDKVGQAIGNLRALKTLRICLFSYSEGDYYDEEDPPSPNWDILAHILSHIRQKVKVDLDDDNDHHLWDAEESQSFARAIHGHPTITCFADSTGVFPYEASDALYSALATLPALESISLSHHGLRIRAEDESALADPESLGRLLRVPSLRSVCFYYFYFTRALCQATTNALMEGTVVTKLDFWSCSFPTGECTAMMANGFGKNASVLSIHVVSPFDEALNVALTAALPLNSTLKELSFRAPPSHGPCVFGDWSQLFLALGKNTGLKILKVDVHGLMDDESLCTAITDGLGMNERLECLELSNVYLRDDDFALWHRALSFLRTSNKALKSLAVGVQHGVTDSCISAFRIEIATILQENDSLEILYIRSSKAVKATDYVALITALHHNRTLQRLMLNDYGTIHLTDDEDKDLATILQKNYALESLPGIDLDQGVGDVGAILRLNAAGRRYLIEDGSSIPKGVEVLSDVSNDINCVFLHLLENPRLCDRSAVEVVSDRTEDSSIANHNRKREQDQALEEGKESRRRRA